MSPNRKAAEDLLLEYVEKIIPGSPNTDLWRQQLAAMDDTAFEEFIVRLETGEEIISLYQPNHCKWRIDASRNIQLARTLGHEFFTKLILTEPVTGQTYLTPVKYMVIDLPVRRQVQLLKKKMSVPDDNATTDDYTDQPTGDSKSSSLSFNELQIMYAQGEVNSIVELIKFRGGDALAFNAMNRDIIATGEFSQASIPEGASKVKSTEVLATYLTAMHLRNNL